MKRFALVALLVACSAHLGDEASAVGGDDSAALTADALALPFYFAMPRAALGDIPSAGSYRTTTVAPRETELAEHAGLHVIAVPERTTSEGRRQVRREMTKNLGDAGLLHDGDVVVGVRFHQKDSVPYVHLQMGEANHQLDDVLNYAPSS